MKKVVLYIIIIFYPYYVSAQFEEQISVKDAIDASYNIRTAGVKIVKDFVYSNMLINFAYKEMDNSFSDSEDAILTLEVYTQNIPDALKTLNILKAMRKKGRMAFLRKPKKEQMAKLNMMLGKLEQLNNTLINQIKVKSNKKVSEEYELARKIEISIQKLTLLYAMESMSDKAEETKAQIQTLSKAIGLMINKLMGSKNNTDKTTYYIKLLKSDYDMFVKTLNNNSNTSFLNTIYVLSNKISNMSRKIANKFG